ncbi:RNA polymerase sigma factor [Patulibacter minatonensis]|uniref:RNA polymerase sigma factor n=1 Tax=Patulibacter minatonensis TaxID=298163 RepID=UPI000685145F|nr:RNA polymerase sigma factor [Patulibacter minatonensis]
MSATMPTTARARPDDDAERVLAVAFRCALGVLRDREAAADVAQEVAVRALTRRRALRDPGALDAWVRTIAIRAAIREAGRTRRRRSAERDHGAREVPPAGPAEAVGDATALLRGLPARQKAALTLRYVHDLPDEEIARILRCRPATVRSLLSRGRDAVRTRLDEDHR